MHGVNFKMTRLKIVIKMAMTRLEIVIKMFKIRGNLTKQWLKMHLPDKDKCLENELARR
jgi:hypothetical protein